MAASHSGSRRARREDPFAHELSEASSLARTAAERLSAAFAADASARHDIDAAVQRLLVDGKEASGDCLSGYPAIYDHFAGVVADGRVAVDREPLRIVADAFLIGRRIRAAPFED